MDKKEIKKRLEYLRKQIKNECISYGEIAELQNLAKYIDKGDVELLEPAGVPEFKDETNYFVNFTLDDLIVFAKHLAYLTGVELKDTDEEKVKEFIYENAGDTEARVLYKNERTLIVLTKDTGCEAVDIIKLNDFENSETIANI